MELFVFARFHARPGCAASVAAALRDEVEPSLAEPGCLAHAVFRSIRDPRQFWIHSRWLDEAAFEEHAAQLHTVRFIERIQPLIDHPIDVAPTHLITSHRFA
jgi:quinol monooxygenase YgiN